MKKTLTKEHMNLWPRLIHNNNVDIEVTNTAFIHLVDFGFGTTTKVKSANHSLVTHFYKHPYIVVSQNPVILSTIQALGLDLTKTLNTWIMAEAKQAKQISVKETAANHLPPIGGPSVSTKRQINEVTSSPNATAPNYKKSNNSRLTIRTKRAPINIYKSLYSSIVANRAMLTNEANNDHQTNTQPQNPNNMPSSRILTLIVPITKILKL